MSEVSEKATAPRSVEAKLNFCGPVEIKPHAKIVSDDGVRSAGERMGGLTFENHVITIEDGSSANLSLDLDRNGFVKLKLPSKVTDFADKGQIASIYHAEVKELLKRLFNPDFIEIPDAVGSFRSSKPKAGENGAAFMSHLDFTPTGAEHAVEHEFPNRRKDVRRWAYIKFWRALSPRAPVDVPLAMLDSQTLKPEDIVPVDTEYMHIPGVTESAALHYNPDHRWIYFSDMTDGDVIMFKVHDSDASKNRVAGHTAFVDPSAPADATPRSSYETRAYVGWL